jgi:hypothetical protein
MDKILTGIYNLYNTNAALKAALPGKLHLEVARQSTVMTFATYNVISGRPEYLLKGTMYEIVSIQFDIYAATNALRITAYNALIALYDDARPLATGYASVLMERTLEQMVRDGEQDEIRRAVVSYDVRYQK